MFVSLPLGKWSNLTHIVQMAWNHQVDIFCKYPEAQKHGDLFFFILPQDDEPLVNLRWKVSRRIRKNGTDNCCRRSIKGRVWLLDLLGRWLFCFFFRITCFPPSKVNQSTLPSFYIITFMYLGGYCTFTIKEPQLCLLMFCILKAALGLHSCIKTSARITCTTQLNTMTSVEKNHDASPGK